MCVCACVNILPTKHNNSKLFNQNTEKRWIHTKRKLFVVYERMYSNTYVSGNIFLSQYELCSSYNTGSMVTFLRINYVYTYPYTFKITIYTHEKILCARTNIKYIKTCYSYYVHSQSLTRVYMNSEE